jgi:hypothetical protein
MHICNPSTQESEAGNIMTSRPAWLHSETLSQRKKTNKKTKRWLMTAPKGQISVALPSFCVVTSLYTHITAVTIFWVFVLLMKETIKR